MKKILGILFFSIFFFILSTSTNFAKEPFTTSGDTTYTISDDGNTHTKMVITLINTTDNYYASSYSITLGFENINNLMASDDNGPITPDVAKKNNSEVVGIHFNTRSVGLGSKLTLTLSFNTPDVAKKTGSTWEVYIPGIADQNTFDNFSAHVVVPASFGPPGYIKPNIGVQTLEPLQFTKAQIGSSGITIGFGENQIYHFNLTYHIGNSNLVPVKTEIALPPTTNYQDISINSINPPPSNVTMDQDGNWLAQYTLLPSQTEDIIVSGNAYVSLNPNPVTPLRTGEIKEYLEPQPYWQVKNTKIQTLAKQLQTPEAIYNYVVNSLQYDYSRVTLHQQRLGALGILENPKHAVCLEFTDLFITLARAAGIPAREVDGYAYTQNAIDKPLSLVKDILHAWPEYYDTDKQTWVMVDPTWGNTTHGVDYFHVLDFDHLAFTINGVNSEYPVPAGGYKLSDDTNTKDVNVTFGNTPEAQTIPYSTSFSMPDNATYGDTLIGNISVQNTGHRLLPPQTITIESPDLLEKTQTITSPEVPPFCTTNIPFTIIIPKSLTNTNPVITMHSGSQTLSTIINVYPWWERNIRIFISNIHAIINEFLGFIYHGYKASSV